jgi:PAS domain S-box-containing protein
MTGFHFACLNDPRLAAHALSPSPAWLWSIDGQRLLWANPIGAAIFENESPAAAAALRFDAKHPAAVQIARLYKTLPQHGMPRLERLRGFGARLGSALLCLCSRFTFLDNTPAILVTATERAGRELTLAERATRLLDGFEPPAAIFSAHGDLIYAMPEAQAHLGGKRDLAALGAEKLAREATLNDSTQGEIDSAPVTVLRLGAGGSVIALLVAFLEQSIPAPAREAEIATRPPDAAGPANDEHARRFPFRFVWQMDAETHFMLDSDELVHLLGPRTAALRGRPWSQIATALHLDPQGQVAAALQARVTWSGIVVQWPVDDDAERLPIELSGLPVFDRERQFAGFRGFGICRDIERLSELRRRRADPTVLTLMEQELPPQQPASAPAPFPAPTPALSPGEHSAFQELARKLGERLKNPGPPEPVTDDFGPEPIMPSAPETPLRLIQGGGDASDVRTILDRLPVGILIYRLNSLVYANRAFLVWVEQPSLEALADAGGLDTLFIETTNAATRDGAKRMSVTHVDGKQAPVEGHLFSVQWNGENALALMLTMQPATKEPAKPAVKVASRRSQQAKPHELETVLDTATDGVLMLDRTGRVLSANRSAEALFGYQTNEIVDLSLGDLLAPESRRGVLEHLGRLARNGGPESLDPGHEAIGRVRQGGLVPLSITMGRVADGEKICAVLRDITAWKRTEEELINAKQQAEKSSAAKSEFLAKISHEIRTPLNAIIGFSEVMMDERFGPIGNDRYRQYLKDIHSSGGHLISLLNDLLDLSKIEAGKLELSFVSVNLNDVVQQCVAILQEQANRERIIIRTSLSVNLPHVVADARSLRQIALNLLSNSIKFTAPGGQVIVSTTRTDEGEVALRIRDTGAGMSEEELQMALEPFGQGGAQAPWTAGGSGLGLPITKALARANQARFHITSQRKDGTLTEIAFPADRVLAQ